jgi:endonuclease/exonuclease/phosphatase family metal-dependent hydrolase
MLHLVAIRILVPAVAVMMLAVVTLASGASAATAASDPLTLMSVNIRYGTANDGDNPWDKRREFLVDVIREASPDVIGLQEALHDQIVFLLDRLPGYASIGVGRDDGKTAGEYTAILYRRATLRMKTQETFWFSDAPSVVASTSWGNRITRICTWARFDTRDGHGLYVYNVHLDHQSQPSRERSAALLRERVAARAPKAPYVIMGDFNAGEKNPAVHAITAGSFGIDTFRVKHPEASPVGTFTGFEFGRVDGEKIDYIFVSPDITVEDAAIVRTARDGRYPSDHFPVTAAVRLPPR